MTHADVASQTQHVSRMKYVADEAVALADIETVLAPGHDARSILSTMLQHSQRIVDTLVNRFFSNNSDNAAHLFILMLSRET
jgi:hypothetical protein